MSWQFFLEAKPWEFQGALLSSSVLVVFSPGHRELDETELWLWNSRKDTQIHIYLPDDSLHLRQRRTNEPKMTKLLKTLNTPPPSSLPLIPKTLFFSDCVPSFSANEDCFLGNNWSHEEGGWLRRLILTDSSLELLSDTGNSMQFVDGFVAKIESLVSGVRWRGCHYSRCAKCSVN